ncbi:MAG: hypothetical protein U1E51_35635 [Candidatus Binatia bacterium]|nr:hypothetical protein [Candidatus Binatia bacterium]
MYRQRNRRRYRVAIGWCALILLLPIRNNATAWHLDDQPFGFRLLTTQDRNLGFSPVAHPVFSSNPAADDFMRDPPFTYKAAPGVAYEYTGLGAGGFVSTVSLAGYFRPSEEGTFMGVYGRTDVFNSTTRQDAKFGLNSNGITLRYSRHLQPNVTLGGSVKLTKVGSSLEDSASKVKSSGFVSEFTLGLLAGLNERWTAGILMTQAPLWSDAEIFSGGVKTTDSSKTLISRLRPGLGWRPTPAFGLYVEGEYIRVANKDAKMNFARGNLLAEYFPTPVVALRAGAILDSAAKVTYNAGFGYYGFSAVKFDVGYSNNAFAEVRHEFGKMHYLFVILSTTF